MHRSRWRPRRQLWRIVDQWIRTEEASPKSSRPTATGAYAHPGTIPGLRDTPYLTNRTVFDLRELPERLIVLGGGPIGLELGDQTCGRNPYPHEP